MLGLRKTDPFHNETYRYGDPNCLIEEGKDCAQSGLIYEITCRSCPETGNQGPKTTRDPGGQGKDNYIGLARTSAPCRMASHLAGQRAKLKSNPLHRHGLEVHNRVPQQYRTRILARERNILPLNILEGLYIERQGPGTSINERNESGRGIVCLTASWGIP